jgi:hypothetical protein
VVDFPCLSIFKKFKTKKSIGKPISRDSIFYSPLLFWQLSFQRLVCPFNNFLTLRVTRDPCFKANAKAQTKLKKALEV